MSPEVSDIFHRLDKSKKSYLRTKRPKREDGEEIPHLIKLPSGTIPHYVALKPYHEFCWRTLGSFVRLKAKPNPKLELDLTQAHIRMRPEEYTAYVWMSFIIVASISVILALLFGGLMMTMLNIDIAFSLMFTIMVMLLPPVLTYTMLMSSPKSKAKSRGRDINKRIGAAMNFISAMASANVNVDVIFKEMSRQKIYGQIKEEAEWITRDTELLGIDILSAIANAVHRTPSIKFQEFLQGVITTSRSGGQLKPYFIQKAEQFEKESKLEMRQELETLGLMAESFVTVVVAFPLFLVVIMAIMAIIGGGGGADSTLLLLYVVVCGMIPISQFGFIFVIWNMTQEASL